MQRNKKTFKGQNIYIGICPQQTKRTVPLVSNMFTIFRKINSYSNLH